VVLGTRLTSSDGSVTSVMSWFRESMVRPQEPLTVPIDARSEIRPSWPTTLLIRRSSLDVRSFASAM
jgi:hypothetical protein